MLEAGIVLVGGLEGDAVEYHILVGQGDGAVHLKEDAAAGAFQRQAIGGQPPEVGGAVSAAPEEYHVVVVGGGGDCFGEGVELLRAELDCSFGENLVVEVRLDVVGADFDVEDGGVGQERSVDVGAVVALHGNGGEDRGVGGAVGREGNVEGLLVGGDEHVGHSEVLVIVNGEGLAGGDIGHAECYLVVAGNIARIEVKGVGDICREGEGRLLHVKAGLLRRHEVVGADVDLGERAGEGNGLVDGAGNGQVFFSPEEGVEALVVGGDSLVVDGYLLGSVVERVWSVGGLGPEEDVVGLAGREGCGDCRLQVLEGRCAGKQRCLCALSIDRVLKVFCGRAVGVVAAGDRGGE